MTIPLFRILELETTSYCNRGCAACMRNTDPEQSRFDVDGEPIAKQMPTELVHRLVDEYAALKSRSTSVATSTVCLSHYNEPLLDKRIVDLARYVRGKGLAVFLCTNGDALTPELASALDGVLNKVVIGVYDRTNAPTQEEFESRFSKTSVLFSAQGVVTHWSPDNALGDLVREHVVDPCVSCRERLIVKYDGEMLLCCDDLSGHFGLGNVDGTSIEDMWFSEKHVRILEDLAAPGGRNTYPHCSTCPRPGPKTG